MLILLTRLKTEGDHAVPVFAQTCLVAFLFLPVSSRGVSAGLSTQRETQADKRSLCLEMEENGAVGAEVAALHSAGEVPQGAECPQGGSKPAPSVRCLWASRSPWHCSLWRPSSDSLPILALGV